jgi:hypothetical protein
VQPQPDPMESNAEVPEDFGIWPLVFFCVGAIAFYSGGWLIYYRRGYQWLCLG